MVTADLIYRAACNSKTWQKSLFGSAHRPCIFLRCLWRKYRGFLQRKMVGSMITPIITCIILKGIQAIQFITLEAILIRLYGYFHFFKNSSYLGPQIVKLREHPSDVSLKQLTKGCCHLKGVLLWNNNSYFEITDTILT